MWHFGHSWANPGILPLVCRTGSLMEFTFAVAPDVVRRPIERNHDHRVPDLDASLTWWLVYHCRKTPNNKPSERTMTV